MVRRYPVALRRNARRAPGLRRRSSPRPAGVIIRPAAAPRGGRPTGAVHSESPGEIIKFLRMKPGHGEILLAEGDPRIREEEELLIEEFRRQLDEGMWAAVPTTNSGSGRREAQLVKTYGDIPTGADRVIFFPRASGG
jgi:hypothetical protein